LSAEVDIYCDDALAKQLNSLKSELRFALIVSSAKVHALTDAPSTASPTDLDNVKLQVNASSFEKCERCWHRRPDVGSATNHPTLCQRCVINVDGEGEVRHYA